MYCSKCGKKIPEGEKYCPSCENPVEKKALFNWNNKYVKIAAAVVAGVILINFISCLGNGKDESVDSMISEESTSVVETVEEVAVEKETEPVQTQEVKEYSVIAANGETLSAVPGFAKVMCTCDYTGTEREDASIYIPSIESFTNGEYKTNEETFADDHYERDFTCDQVSDGAFVEDYIADLVSNCGFTLEKTLDMSNNQKVYLLNYEGEIAHGADDWLGTDYDLSIMFYNGADSSGVCFRYPAEVTFAYDGDSQTYYTCVDTEAEYKKENGTSIFTIANWGTAYDDYIYLDFDDEAYQAGDIITLDDLAQQENVGEDPLCKVSVWGPLVSGEPGVGIVNADKFTNGSIEILEKSDSVTAIHYYFEVPNHASTYTLEGVVAAKTSDGATGDFEDGSENDLGNDLGNDSSGSNGPAFSVDDKQSCTFCGGSGMTTCHTCGGDGYEQCPNCYGSGKYYDSVMGMYKTCGRCNGKCSIPCSNSQCVNGQVTCDYCN